MDDSFRVLVSRLAALDDPRQAGKVSYPLVEMAMVAVAGVIADCDRWEDVAEFGRDRLDWLRQFLPFENGVPSHDTFARVFSVVDVERLEACAVAWVQDTFLPVVGGARETTRPDEASTASDATAEGRGSHVAFDGKTMRGSHDLFTTGSLFTWSRRTPQKRECLWGRLLSPGNPTRSHPSRN